MNVNLNHPAVWVYAAVAVVALVVVGFNPGAGVAVALVLAGVAAAVERWKLPRARKPARPPAARTSAGSSQR